MLIHHFIIYNHGQKMMIRIKMCGFHLSFKILYIQGSLLMCLPTTSTPILGQPLLAAQCLYD